MSLLARPRRHRRTKIVATLGPASRTPEMIERLFRAGADVFRLNFSHGSHADHAENIAIVRALETQVGRPIGLLADVQGPKLRIGRFSGGRVHLSPGQDFRLDSDPTPGSARRVQLPHPEILAAAAADTTLLLDDGKLRLRVARNRGDHLECEVLTGGPLSDRKGVNVPDMVLPIPALTCFASTSPTAPTKTTRPTSPPSAPWNCTPAARLACWPTCKAQNCALAPSRTGSSNSPRAPISFSIQIPSLGIKTVFGFLIPKSCLR